jgi:hypothetical protein
VELDLSAIEIAIGIGIERQVLDDETVIADEGYDFDSDFDSDLDRDAKEQHPCVADMCRRAV